MKIRKKPRDRPSFELVVTCSFGEVSKKKLGVRACCLRLRYRPPLPPVATLPLRALPQALTPPLYLSTHSPFIYFPDSPPPPLHYSISPGSAPNPTTPVLPLHALPQLPPSRLWLETHSPRSPTPQSISPPIYYPFPLLNESQYHAFANFLL